MQTKLITALLILVAIINLLPLIGIISAEKLSGLYGIPAHEANLQILLRHRALLFGIIGGFIFFAAFNPSYQIAAMVMALFSMLGFILLVQQVGGSNELLRRVMMVDVVGLFLLVASVVLYVLKHR